MEKGALGKTLKDTVVLLINTENAIFINIPVVVKICILLLCLWAKHITFALANQIFFFGADDYVLCCYTHTNLFFC